MVNKPIEHTIECDLCHKEFPLSKEVLKEEQVTLTKEGLEPHPVLLTLLRCPCCGKSYPVIMDDESTLPLLEKLRTILAKLTKQARLGFQPNTQTEKKRKELNRKLDFRRQRLAEKYYQSYYQLEDGTVEQLEYRYRAR